MAEFFLYDPATDSVASVPPGQEQGKRVYSVEVGTFVNLPERKVAEPTQPIETSNSSDEPLAQERKGGHSLGAI